MVERIFESVQVEEQGFNAALAVLRLSRRYGPARLEAVCRIALQSQVRSPRYAHLRPLLETGQDKNLSTRARAFPRRRRLRARQRLLRRRHPMSSLDIETKRKLREMNATEMLQAIEAQDEAHEHGLTLRGAGPADR